MADLSSSQQSVLIELYRLHSVLWDHSLPGYKDYNCRGKALTAMLTAFEQRTGIRLEYNDLKTKLQSFRTAVSREMTKFANAVCSGAEEDYTPSYGHWRELQFLTKVIKKRDPKCALFSTVDEEEEPYPSTQTSTPELITVKEEPDNSLVWMTHMNTPFPISVPDNGQARPDSPSLSNQSSASSHQQQQQQQIPSSPPSTKVSSQNTDSSLCVCAGGQAVPAELRSATPPIPRPQPSPEAFCIPSSSSASSTAAAAAVVPRSAKRSKEDAALDGHDRDGQKSARLQPPDPNTVEEERYGIWARNLIQDLKTIKNEKRRRVLQIKINRLVQDEILKELEAEDEDMDVL